MYSSRFVGSVRSSGRTAGQVLAVLALIVLGLVPLSQPAQATVWAEPGDMQLRSDIELLAAARMVDGITMTWPLPWSDLVDRLKKADLRNRSPHVVNAAARVLNRAVREGSAGLHYGATVTATDRPSVVRGYDGMSRGDAQGQVFGEVIGDRFNVRLAIGAEVDHGWDRARIKPDGSFAAVAVGGLVAYAGYRDHWWGPGRISALAVSTNARPIPQVGFARRFTHPSEHWLLSWMGPWQFEFFVGLLDDERIVNDTWYNAFRLTMNPFPGFEFGITRTQMFCGDGRKCNPVVDYFDVNNSQSNTNRTNDQLVFDFKYSTMIRETGLSIYSQIMNEDSSPIKKSYSTYLVGGTVWAPLAGQQVRLTAEYTDSVPTAHLFSFGYRQYGLTYNNGDYLDGTRYRGRTMGFSLDSDSRLATLQASLVDDRAWVWQLTLNQAQISSGPLSRSPRFTNIVSSEPVRIYLGEARVTIPWTNYTFDIAGRLQDDQPRPQKGFAASIEGGIQVRF